MNKKILIISLILIAIIAVVIYFLTDNNSINTNNENISNMQEKEVISNNVVNEANEVTEKKEENEVNATEAEISLIQEYLNKIYNYFETTMPEFENINEANEEWIWGVSLDNIYDYTTGEAVSYNDLTTSANKLFGDNLTLTLPKKEIGLVEYNEENDTYIVAPRGGVLGVLGIVVKSAKKTTSGFEVETVEYFEEMGWEDTRDSNKVRESAIKSATSNPKKILIEQNSNGDIYIVSSKSNKD